MADAAGAVRIDGGDPVHEEHQLFVKGAMSGMTVRCRGCDDWFVLDDDAEVDVGVLIWLAAQHRGRIPGAAAG